MKPLSAYPVTFPFGATTSPYSASNPHKGDDHAAPLGTPVDVNGVTIGLVGSTGFSTGNHCHIGRFVNGQPTNPKGGGFKFTNAVVTQIAQDNTNGKYVRIDADGASWVYLHLSDNSKVKVGQKLQGGEMPTLPTKQQVADAYGKHNLKADGSATPATQADLDYYSTKDVSVLYAVLLDHETALVHQLVAQSTAEATVLKPGKYQVN